MSRSSTSGCDPSQYQYQSTTNVSWTVVYFLWMGILILSWFGSFCSNFFCNYHTTKEVQVRKTYVAVIHRILQSIVIACIAIYIVWIKKGYQDVEVPRGSSIIKVKGVARNSIMKSNIHANKSKQSLWEASEYLLPAIEHNTFFIFTRKRVNYYKTQETCPSALTDKLFCNSTSNSCQKGMLVPDSLGILTGKCVFREENRNQSVCEINGWCPEELSYWAEYETNIDDLQNLTVFIKTIVSFAQYDIRIRTVKDSTNFSCRFTSASDHRCPIFSIGYILQNLRYKYSQIDRKALYLHGGLIEIEQKWKCNFDFAQEVTECFPSFTFNLLQSGSDELSPGINYRFVERMNVNGIEYRRSTKVSGLRFVLSIRGKGRRFDILHLFVAIGSGVGYMIIAEIISEMIFMKVHRHRQEYRQNKIKICHLKQSNTNDLREVVGLI